MNKMLRASATFAAPILVSHAAAAQAEKNEIAASIHLVSDRLWRGLSQTEGDPGLVAEAKWNHKNGPFAGLVATNFSSDQDSASGIVLTPFVGFNRTVGRINFDAGYLHREHLGASRKNFGEVTASAGFKLGAASLRPGIFYAVDHYLPGHPIYAYVDGRTKLTQIGKIPLAFSAHLGRFDARGGVDDYTNWRLGISAPVRGISFSANLTDANIDERQTKLEGGRHGGTRIAIAAFVLF